MARTPLSVECAGRGDKSEGGEGGSPLPMQPQQARGAVRTPRRLGEKERGGEGQGGGAPEGLITALAPVTIATSRLPTATTPPALSKGGNVPRTGTAAA